MVNKFTKDFIKYQKFDAARHIANYIQEVRNGNMPSELSFPIGIQFELTAKCNLFCKHCYNRSYAERESPMKYENWENLIKNIIENGGIFQCILSGGEPLLIGHKLIDLIKPLSDDGTSFILITNGLLVDKFWVEELRQFSWYWIQVSIDHLIEEKHDDFRQRKGSWRKAVEAALMFSGAGFPLRIAHTLTPENLKYLPKFADFCYKLGASTLITGEIMLSGRANDNKDLLMNEILREEMCKTISSLRKIYNGKMDIVTSAKESIELRRRQKTLNTSVIVRPDGTVRLDCTMPAIIGNVLDEPFSEIWKKKGNICWKDKKVNDYISDLEQYGDKITHINHVTPDILL